MVDLWIFRILIHTILNIALFLGLCATDDDRYGSYSSHYWDRTCNSRSYGRCVMTRNSTEGLIHMIVAR